MKYLQISLVVIFLLGSSSQLFSKDIVLNGKITTFNKCPLNKVSVQVKGDQKEVFTDNEGNFHIVCNDDDKLLFHAKGFYSKKISMKNLDGEMPITVNLKLKKGEKNYELATVYGHISEETLSRDILLVNPKLDYGAYTNITEILNEKATLNSGRFPNNPLYIVDGFEVDASYFKSIPTTDIESIAVLQNTASARYGVKGYEGVIEVVTKNK